MKSRAFHLIAIVVILLPHPVAPAIINVDGLTGDVVDDDVCTLPEAIDNANDDAETHNDCVIGDGADEIILSGDVTLTDPNNGPPGGGNGLPVVDSTITIEGGGYTISRDPGSDPFRIIRMNEFADLTLNNVTISGGRIEQNGGQSIGGGILNANGILTLYNSTLSGNTAAAATTPKAYGGGLYNKGTSNLINSTVSGNSAEVIDIMASNPFAAGGGISNCAGSCSGGDVSVLVLTNSTVSGNSATVDTPDASPYTAGAYAAALYNVRGSATITNSTLSSNSAYATDDSSFGPFATGGAILTVDADLFLLNSTIAGNVVAAPGGDVGGAALDYFGFGMYPAIEISETLLGHNMPAGYTCFGIEAAYDFGNNLADDASCATIPDTLAGLDATLADNGGPTQTHALMEGSTAIDLAGDCGLATDQRGVDRPVGFCDSGSYEFVAACAAANGDDFTVPDGITAIEETFETCNSLTVNDRDIVGPDGHLILRTAGTVTIGEGFECDVDGRLTVDNDGTIVMPDQP